jgi:hypothetical protein
LQITLTSFSKTGDAGALSVENEIDEKEGHDLRSQVPVHDEPDQVRSFFQPLSQTQTPVVASSSELSGHAWTSHEVSALLASSPAALVWPVGQDTQTLLSTRWLMPHLMAEHDDAPVGADLPASHARHDEPIEGEKVLTAHGLHTPFQESEAELNDNAEVLSE